MKAILTEAAADGNPMSRTLDFRSRQEDDWAYYPGSSWTNILWQGGYTFETPPPLVTPEGIKPFPATGAPTRNSRSAFFYGYTSITPAMIMRLTNVGSQYLLAFLDGEKQSLDSRQDLSDHASTRNSRGMILVVYGLRQTDQVGVVDAAAIPPGRNSNLSLIGR